MNGKLLGYIGAGQTVDIVDGPTCADGYIWWKVQTRNGLVGWTVEGDSSGYWLVPPLLSTPTLAQAVLIYWPERGKSVTVLYDATQWSVQPLAPKDGGILGQSLTYTNVLGCVLAEGSGYGPPPSTYRDTVEQNISELVQLASITRYKDTKGEFARNYEMPGFGAFVLGAVGDECIKAYEKVLASAAIHEVK